MVNRAHRSHAFARKKRRIPGGGWTIHYARKKPHRAHCQCCNGLLSGIPRVRQVQMRRLAHTQRRPERPYTGNLCPECLKEKIRDTVWSGAQK